MDALVRSVGPDEAYRRWMDLRRARRDCLVRAAEDPVRHAPRPNFWKVPRKLLAREDRKVLVLLGGNRSGKSYFAGYQLMETALSVTAAEVAMNEGVTFLVTSETEDSSKDTVQRIVWALLPESIRALNGKRDHVSFVHYSVKNGFTDNVLVLPSGAKIAFATYNQDPGGWEGRELGLKHRRAMAWWADEDMPMTWWGMFQRRGQYRPGYGIWSFTPVNGITPTIRDAVGTGKVRICRPARLLPSNQILVPGLKPGMVPFVRDGAAANTVVCYFHSDLTPFSSGGRRYGDLVKELVAGKAAGFVLSLYYGYTEDVTGRAWPKYSRQVHVIPRSDLPATGCNYMFIDPAGHRSWFMLWVRVAPGNPRRLYIYRDWPDRRRFGEWAVPTTRQLSSDSRRGRDGDIGPAQRNLGWGIARYKAEILRLEEIPWTQTEDGAWADPDPYRRAQLDRAMWAAAKKPIRERVTARGLADVAWSREDVESVAAKRSEPVREEVLIRFIDPRAAGQEQASSRGGETIITLFANQDLRPDGSVIAPPMDLVPAYSGRGIEEGVRAVNDLLDYNEEAPIVPALNEPRLYLADVCEQLDWTLANYTAEGSESDGGKDPADVLRYMALATDLQYYGSNIGRTRRGYAY